MTKKYLVFDLDGTLINSIPDLCREIGLFLQKQGERPLTEPETVSIIGNGARVMLAGAFKLVGKETTPEQFEALLSDWLKQYAEAPMNQTKPWKNVVKTLEKLKADGFQMAVCTNKPAAPTKAILQKLDLEKYFDVVLSADSLPVRKPRPEPLWEAVKRMGGTNDNAVMIGDSEADAEAARNAGFPVVLLSFGYAHVPFSEIKPDALIDDFGDLPAVLSKL